MDSEIVSLIGESVNWL